MPRAVAAATKDGTHRVGWENARNHRSLASDAMTVQESRRQSINDGLKPVR
jgi:hypothetical protein